MADIKSFNDLVASLGKSESAVKRNNMISDIMTGVGLLANLANNFSGVRNPVQIGNPLVAGGTIFSNMATRAEDKAQQLTAAKYLAQTEGTPAAQDAAAAEYGSMVVGGAPTLKALLSDKLKAPTDTELTAQYAAELVKNGKFSSIPEAYDFLTNRQKKSGAAGGVTIKLDAQGMRDVNKIPMESAQKDYDEAVQAQKDIARGDASTPAVQKFIRQLGAVAGVTPNVSEVKRVVDQQAADAEKRLFTTRAAATESSASPERGRGEVLKKQQGWPSGAVGMAPDASGNMWYHDNSGRALAPVAPKK